MADRFKEDDIVVVLFHDHGSRYVGKIFNDDWMRERGFLEEEKKNARDLINSHSDKRLVSVAVSDPASRAIVLMKQYGVSQIPVIDEGQFVGSLSDNKMYSRIVETPELKELPVKNIMEPPFPEINGDVSINEVSKLFNNKTKAVIVNYGKDERHIITVQDMIDAIT